MAVKGAIARICYDPGSTRLRAAGGWRHARSRRGGSRLLVRILRCGPAC